MNKANKTPAKKVAARKSDKAIELPMDRAEMRMVASHDMTDEAFNTKTMIFLVDKDWLVLLIKNIISVEVHHEKKNHLIIHLTGMVMLEVAGTLQDIRKQLPTNFFIAAQQSFLVGRIHIKKVIWMKNGEAELEMTEGINIHIPKKQKQNLVDELHKNSLFVPLKIINIIQKKDKEATTKN